MRRSLAKSFFIFFSSIKFAIPALFLFMCAMIYGTLAESRYGAMYANLVVYHSNWFYLIESLIVLSLLLSMLARFPWRKRLIGFYLVHCSLIIIMLGAMTTRYFGIDGTIELSPSESVNSVSLSEDVLYLKSEAEENVFDIPLSVSDASINKTFNFFDGTKVELKKFIPYAKKELNTMNKKDSWASHWLIKNDNFQNEFKLAHPPSVGFLSRIEQGPLKIEILPEFCFTALESLLDSLRQLPIRYLFIDTEKHFSQKLTDIEHAHLFKSPDGSTYKLTQEENKKVGIKFVRFSAQKKTQIFIPRFASEPIDRHLELDVASPYRLYDLEKLKSTNNIFLTQTKADTIRLGYGKSNQWKFEAYNNNQAILLPWMGFQLVLLKHWKDTALRWSYVEGEPNKEESKNIKALVAVVTKGEKSEELWFTDQNQTQSQISNLQGFIRKQLVFLPFQMELVQFKMDKIPGTDKPASFESFVKLKDTGETAHIYMNNPLKRGGYTFYQASYFQDEKGAYHSVLSVNRDPGRFIKYFGSAFLVIGMILTFLILYGYWKVT